MKTAMILAAGRGERLRPLTDIQPKALCMVRNIPIIEYHVANLALAGFQRIIINHAHLGGQIRRHLGSGSRWGIEILYSPEPPGGLETGGGIVNALPLLGEEPFITVNADIVTDYNFASLTLPTNSLAHIVLVNKPSYLAKPDFGLSKTFFVENSNRQFTYPGITCFHPQLFRNSKIGRYSVTPLLRELVSEKHVTGELFTGKWVDIGTPEQLALANEI